MNLKNWSKLLFGFIYDMKNYLYLFIVLITIFSYTNIPFLVHLIISAAFVSFIYISVSIILHLKLIYKELKSINKNFINTNKSLNNLDGNMKVMFKSNNDKTKK